MAVTKPPTQRFGMGGMHFVHADVYEYDEELIHYEDTSPEHSVFYHMSILMTVAFTVLV